MNKSRIKYLLLGLSLTLVVSCNVSVPATPEGRYNYWWSKWLDEPTCKSPCWMNIVPGETSLDEALSILENVPGVVITYKNKYGIDWSFNQDKTDSGTLRILPDEIVSVVWLGNSSDKQLYLETVVTTYGYPSYVELYDCRIGMCETILVYPDIGLLVDVFLEDINDSGNNLVNIQSDVAVTGVYFFQPGIENFLSMPEFQEYELLKWKGYTNYP